MSFVWIIYSKCTTKYKICLLFNGYIKCRSCWWNFIQCYVHYPCWHSKYNKWRNASEIIDIPEVYLEASAEARELFFTNFRTSIKSLYIARGRLIVLWNYKFQYLSTYLKNSVGTKTVKNFFKCSNSALNIFFGRRLELPHCKFAQRFCNCM